MTKHVMFPGPDGEHDGGCTYGHEAALRRIAELDAAEACADPSCGAPCGECWKRGKGRPVHPSHILSVVDTLEDDLSRLRDLTKAHLVELWLDLDAIGPRTRELRRLLGFEGCTSAGSKQVPEGSK